MACFDVLVIWRALAIAFVLVGLTSPALAQTLPKPTPSARELFDQGRALLKLEDYANACPKFEASQRLDPGGGTLLNLALCNELLGKTATAWAQFQEGLEIARRDGREDRAALARAHLAGLEGKLSHLTVTVPGDVRTPGLVIRRNGVEIEDASWGMAIPVDPGEQVIEATAPGKKSFTVSFAVSVFGETKQMSVPPLVDAQESTPVPIAAAHAVQPTAATKPKSAEDINPRSTAPPPSSASSTQRWAGVIVGGAGIATLGIAAYLGLHALSLDHSSNDVCPTSNWCEGPPYNQNQQALRYARASTYTTVAGVLLTGAGAVMFFSAPTRHGVNVGIGGAPGLGVAALSGKF